MNRFLYWLTALRFAWADVAIVAVVVTVANATVTWAHWPPGVIWGAAGIAAGVSQDLTRRVRSRVQVRPGAGA